MARGLLDPDAARRVADALRQNNFTVDGIDRLVGPAAIRSLTAADAASRAARSAVSGDDSPLGLLVRLLVLGEALDAGAVRQVLPAAAGALLERDNGRLRAAYDVWPYGDETRDWWVVSDRTDERGRPLRPDHVLGVGGAAATLAQLTVRRPVARALDVGTGCGVQSLHLSTHADEVTATDLVPRALDLAATSAALSGVEVELLEGDLTRPVQDREFDLVVCNPPFVLGPASRYAYRDAPRTASTGSGGADEPPPEAGDAFCRRVVRSCAEVLAPGGVAQVLVDWLHVRGEDWRDRVGAWVTDLGCDAWLIERELVDPVDYVRTWTGDAGEADDVGLAREWLDWFAVRRVEAVGFGWVTLRRGDAPHRVAVERVLHPVDQPLGAEIAGWLDRVTWLREHDDAGVVRHAFRRGPQVRLDTAARPASDSGWETVARSLAVDAGFRWSLPADEPTAALVAGCDGTRPLGTLIAVLAATLPGHSQGDLEESVCALVRGLVDRGVLLP